MKRIFISQYRLKELDEYAKHRTEEIFKKEILEDSSLKEYIVFDNENKENAYFIELFKNNLKSNFAFSGRIYTNCGNFGKPPTLAAFGICTDIMNYTEFGGVKRSFPHCSNMCNFLSYEIKEQKELIDKTINTFMKDFKEKLYEYYNIQK